VNVTGGVAINSSGSRINLTSDSAIELGVGNSIANQGNFLLSGNSQVRSDVVSGGFLQAIDSSITRSVTLLENSTTVADNATVGSLTQDAGATLRVGLRAASDFDNLTSTGAASLAGKVQVVLLNGFAPTLGAQFPILIADSILGAFAVENFASAPLASGLAWDVVYGPTSVTLKVISTALPGDYNQNGVDDAADYVVWRDNLGAPAGTLPNDTAGGTINQAHYNVWRANFGATAGPAAGSGAAQLTALPEPMTMLMLLPVIIVAALPRYRTA
jgi:hypothetical protein